MHWYYLLAIISLSVCLLSCIYHTYRIISLGNPPEYARRAGHVGKAVQYSFTKAMSPKVKESAYLHLPTYLAGIVYHIGTFLAIFLFILSLFNIWLSGWMMWIAAAVLMAAGISGLAILVKRISKHELRSLSNPDDYISNILVTAFQLVSTLALIIPAYAPVYFIVASMLLLYFPLGKLKHAVYFFAARYHLGFFYGWRNVWPPKPIKK
jgi:nitrate reductase gamma subunit